MALDDLLARLKTEAATPITPPKSDGVTPEAVPLQAATPVTPVTLVTPAIGIVERKTASPAQSEKPLPVTMEHFRAQGVELLREDLAFLCWHLPKDTASRNRAIDQYGAIWRDAADRESLGHKKASRGRFAANTWLRERGV
jgi:hypothetical protein